MLQDKIREIEMEMDGYLVLLHESEKEKERAKYRGVIQGLSIALMILKEGE